MCAEKYKQVLLSKTGNREKNIFFEEIQHKRKRYVKKQKSDGTAIVKGRADNKKGVLRYYSFRTPLIL